MTGRRPAVATPLLCAIIFVSGASALLFETVWFREASVTFGNSVWASALVLCGFMAGLAIGNGLAAGIGRRTKTPLRVYSLLECAIGASGLAVVFLLPKLSTLLAPMFRHFVEHAAAQNGLRLLLALALFALPAAAMGATLPLLVRAQSQRGSEFGRALGLLYGWNTAGAVAGALASELIFIRHLGLRGTGAAAASLNLGAAICALLLARSQARHPVEEPPCDPSVPTGVHRGKRLLVAAFLSGLALLALEVVWIRFLLLFVPGVSLAFSVMLALVLAGIAAGGLAAGRVRWGDLDRRPLVAVLPLAAGAVLVLCYTGFPAWLGAAGTSSVRSTVEVFRLGIFLMFPVSFFSGMIFTAVGDAYHRESQAGEVRATGLLTLFNTIGAASGSLLGGFFLLPGLGMESSFHLIALIYGLAAALVFVPTSGAVRRVKLAVAAAAALFTASVALFPFGSMDRTFLTRAASRFSGPENGRVVATREGLTETILYLQQDFLGEPLSHQLVTNSHSMSGTAVRGRRYMKMFVYLPVALRPESRTALLISFGVGSTAKALVDTRSLQSIDVVDISRDILEMSAIVFPDASKSPLADPRVRVHVEDGRHFLQTTDRHFDIITAEPPPPRNAGIVNLYTREYFSLLRERLEPGGIASYWLPIHSLDEPDALAITKGFCEVFDDCTLWTGAASDWMLLGTRGLTHGPSEEELRRQWADPVVADELRTLLFETPEQFATSFLGDADQLSELTRGVLPLTDDFPLRLGSDFKPLQMVRLYGKVMNSKGARKRFARSRFISRFWPATSRRLAMELFGVQSVVNTLLNGEYKGNEGNLVVDLQSILARPELHSLPSALAGGGLKEEAIAERAQARGASGAAVDFLGATRALGQRDYASAERLLASAEAQNPGHPILAPLRIALLFNLGRSVEAESLLHRPSAPPSAASQRVAAWYRSRPGAAAENPEGAD